MSNIRSLVKESDTKYTTWIRVDTRYPFASLTPESAGEVVTAALRRFENHVLLDMVMKNGELWLHLKKP